MMKPFISLRKFTLLRFKFWRERKQKEGLIEYPSPSELLKKSDEIFQELMKAERVNDFQEMAFWKGARSVTDWIIEYGETKKSGNS